MDIKDAFEEKEEEEFHPPKKKNLPYIFLENN